MIVEQVWTGTTTAILIILLSVLKTARPWRLTRWLTKCVLMFVKEMAGRSLRF